MSLQENVRSTRRRKQCPKRKTPATSCMQISFNRLYCACAPADRARRRQRQKRHQTRGLISETKTRHVRYTVCYISLLSSANQRRAMTKFKVLCRM